MEQYEIKIKQGESLTLTHPGTDDVEISLDGGIVADAYIVSFEERTIDGEPGYAKTTCLNGIKDLVMVKKSQLSDDDLISEMEMGAHYLFICVLKDKNAKQTTPYYIKLNFQEK